jgi:hypothetical protein
MGYLNSKNRVKEDIESKWQTGCTQSFRKRFFCHGTTETNHCSSVSDRLNLPVYLTGKAAAEMTENNIRADDTKSDKMIIYQWGNKGCPDSFFQSYVKDETFYD